MAKNDSGGDNDPWNSRKKEQGPPDLDKLFSQFQKRLRGVVGSGNSSSMNSGRNSTNFSSGLIFSLIAAAVLTIWCLSGFYVVRPAEQAAVLLFGRYVEQQGPGLHWLPSLIEKAYKVNTEMIHQYPYRSEMLTEDESIVDVQISVQYRFANPEKFLFNVADPIESVQQATASALRQVVGHNTMDDIMTKGRELVKQQVKRQLNLTLAEYETGIEITDVNLQSAVPPAQVRDAFDDAIRAQEDERRYRRQAEAYRKQILPAAYGKAQSVLAKAQAYERNVRLEAEGSTARFAAILPEYQRAPQVTRERMYLSTIERVLKNNQLIFIDSKQANNLLYLPLDKLFQNQGHEKIKPNILADAQSEASTNSSSSAATNSPNGQSSYLAIADRDSYLGRFEQ